MTRAFFAAPDMVVPLRRLPCSFYQLGTDKVFDLDVVANEPLTDVKVSCTKTGWTELSTDGGSVYNPIPSSDDASAGLQLGPMTAGQVKSVKLKVSLPGAADARMPFVGLVLGFGT